MLDMGVLYIVATPIGNLEDITIRAIKTLLLVPVIACEDTRVTGNLLKLLEGRYSHSHNAPSDPPLNLRGGRKGELFTRRYISVRDWNEASMVERVMVELANNDVALVSDAGTPLVSDPGFKVVREARKRGFRVSPIPGPSAAIAALSASGLPTNKFMFWGFLPKKWELAPLVTHIIYESPIRAENTVANIKDRYPLAKVLLATELTKIHEYIGEEMKGTKGEVTILVYWEE
jgi:16S rRNA (cytidine1402-2'-O)-methyltransferase